MVILGALLLRDYVLCVPLREVLVLSIEPAFALRDPRRGLWCIPEGDKLYTSAIRYGCACLFALSRAHVVNRLLRCGVVHQLEGDRLYTWAIRYVVCLPSRSPARCSSEGIVSVLSPLLCGFDIPS